MNLRIKATAAILAVFSAVVAAEDFALLPQLKAYKVRESWRQPVAPLKIADNTWQIGTQGITSLLLKDSEGAILIDGGMAQTADHLLANMRALGIQPSDLKFILHSHAHADHVGPLAAIQRATGAKILSNAESVVLMARGGADDIHFGDEILFSPIKTDRILHQGEAVTLGNLRLRVHFVSGHTPGSMAWTWQDTVDGKITNIAYVDSLTAPGYQLLNNPRYPDIMQDYRASFERIRNLPCDLLLTPHIGASGWLFQKTATQEKSVSCKQYADNAEKKLNKQFEAEKSKSAS